MDEWSPTIATGIANSSTSGFQEELGITPVVLEMNYGGQMPNEQVFNSVRLMAEKVAPKFK